MRLQKVYSKVATTFVVVILCSVFSGAQENKHQKQPAEAVIHGQEAKTREAIAQWRKLQYGMFLHFGMSTFTGIECDPGDKPSETYAPTALDVDQWIRVARDAGMKYAVLTSKHVAGHCLWDSKVDWHGKEFDYDVATSSNKTDVVAEFMAACKQYGVRPGLYWCLLDFRNNSVPNHEQWQIGKLPEDFFQLAKDQLTELLTNYPGLNYLWLDIPRAISPAQRQEIYDMIKKVNPDCVVLFNHGLFGCIRKKDGYKLMRIANLRSSWPSDILNTERWPKDFKAGDDWFVSPQTFKGETYHLGYEHCDTICKNWFWVKGNQPKPIEELYHVYKQVTDAGGNFMLNIPPDRSGRIPEYHIKALMELKKAIDDPSTLSTSK